MYFKAIGNALCATGFGESIAGVIAGEKDGSPWIERIVAAAVIIFLTLINLAGVKVEYSIENLYSLFLFF